MSLTFITVFFKEKLYGLNTIKELEINASIFFHVIFLVVFETLPTLIYLVVKLRLRNSYANAVQN